MDLLDENPTEEEKKKKTFWIILISVIAGVIGLAIIICIIYYITVIKGSHKFTGSGPAQWRQNPDAYD